MIAEAMGVENAATGIYELARVVGAPRALRDIGIDYDDLDQIVTLVMAAPPVNPEPLTDMRLRALLENAYHGIEPEPIS